jgi:hypothetical protein
MAQGPPLTEFARKYGSKSSSNRSGLTPDGLSIPFIGASPFSTWDARDYQRKNLYGFTSEELQRLDCLPTRELKPGNLQNHILPLMQRGTWETGPLPDYKRDYLYPLPAGVNGFWEAKNDSVWNVLQPCLVLACRMLLSMHMLPWVSHILLRCIICTFPIEHV